MKHSEIEDKRSLQSLDSVALHRGLLPLLMLEARASKLWIPKLDLGNKQTSETQVCMPAICRPGFALQLFLNSTGYLSNTPYQINLASLVSSLDERSGIDGKPSPRPLDSVTLHRGYSMEYKLRFRSFPSFAWERCPASWSLPCQFLIWRLGTSA